MSKFCTSLFRHLNTKITPSLAYHIKTDGKTEIGNRKLVEMIKANDNFDKLNWDLFLEHFEVAYNSLVHPSPSFMSIYLNYGQQPRRILLLTLKFCNPCAEGFYNRFNYVLNIAQDNTKKHNISMSKQTNKKRVPSPFGINNKNLLTWITGSPF